MDKALSDDDIRPYIKNIITYDELKHINADKLMGMLPLAILYNTAENYGHWTLLHRTSDGIEFFDSYGYKPDREFALISKEYQQPFYLLKMLKDLSKVSNIHYNQYDLQSKSGGVNTCGRWIILRCVFGKWNIDKFKEAIDRVCRELGISRDEFVVRATS